jgi:diguanylate cyclase (GGDEF)-like protein/putative nucleotidyltransferase with HDIG domain
MASATLAREGSTRRPLLLAVVFAFFLMLIGITAGALVTITSDHLATAGLNTTVSGDAALAGLFANDWLDQADFGAVVAPDRVEAIDARLVSLVRERQILRIEIRSPAGRVLFASDPSVVGLAPPPSSALRGAASGTPFARVLETGQASEAAGGSLGATRVIEEYLPISRTDGQTVGVMGVWRDADVLASATARAQQDVLIVVLAASLVLAAILFLIFRAAQARIGHQQRQLVEALRRDSLTGLLDHGAIVASLAERMERVRRDGERLAVALVDIDNFRLLNETHGHRSADSVLLAVAAAVAEIEPRADCTARYGPDELLLVVPGGGTDAAEDLAGRLQAALGELSVAFEGTERLPVTVSVGIAGAPEHAESVTDLLSAAAVALADARAGGGDAVRVARAGAEPEAARGFDVLQGLVIAVDHKDRYTKRHSEDVSRYAVFLARRIGLDEETCSTIRVSGLLHDVGKIGIPDGLLRKPGKLTAEELDVFRQHVALGDAIVRDVGDVDRVRAGIRHHHERWDGRGYLEGLAGEEIPLIGRIMAVADAFSAMTTTRPYRKALPIEEALKRLGDAAGSQLEERLVVAFIAGIETDAEAPLPGTPASTLWRPDTRVA